MKKLYHGNLKVCWWKNLLFTTSFITDNSLSPTTKWNEDSKFCLIFKGSCLKQKNVTYAPNNRIKFFIAYESDTWLRGLNSDFTLKDCLFVGVKLAKNTGQDKYVYSGYGVGFDSCSEFSLLDGDLGCWYKLICAHW